MMANADNTDRQTDAQAMMFLTLNVHPTHAAKAGYKNATDHR